MALQLISPPCVEPVNLYEAKAHLRVTHKESDKLISSLIVSAREYCEGFQNRQYVTATWCLWLDDWPGKDYVVIPRPPLQKVNNIKYYGRDGAEHELDTAVYYVDNKNEPGRVCLSYGRSWPGMQLRPSNGIAIEYIAGYPPDEGPPKNYVKNIPQRVKQAIQLKVELDCDYHQKEDADRILDAVHRLLWLDRIVW